MIIFYILFRILVICLKVFWVLKVRIGFIFIGNCGVRILDRGNKIIFCYYLGLVIVYLSSEV